MFAFVLIQCKRPDTIPPEITLVDGNEIEHYFKEPFEEPGAYVLDNRSCKDGYYEVIGEVNENKAGNYRLQYFVEDDAGNVTVANRNVKVIFREKDYYSVLYRVTDSCTTNDYTYDALVQTCNCDSFAIQFSNFANFGTFSYIDAGIVGEFNDSLVISQFRGGVAFEGGGKMSPYGDTIYIEFTANDSTNIDVCTSLWIKDE